MDFTDVIEEFFTGTYTVTRTAPRTLTKGRANAPSTSSVSIRASAQQASGRDLAVFPEGNYPTDAIVFYTATELLTAGAAQEADVVTYRGESYEIQHVERWDDLGNYFKAIGVLV